MTREKPSDQIRQSVRERYAEVVRRHSSVCCTAEPGCCGEPSCCSEGVLTDEAYAQVIGYSADEVAAFIDEGIVASA